MSGGSNNAASGYVASVSGGGNNTAEADYSSVPGGYSNTAKADYSSVPGWDDIVCNPITHAACGEGAIVPPD